MNDLNTNPVAAGMGSMGKKVIAGVVVVVVLGFVASRLGNSTSEKNIEATSSDSVTIKNDQGTYTSSNKLPEDFPSDVPVYPGAAIQGSVSANQTADQKGGHYVTLETNDSLDTVTTWYKTKVAANGWKIGSNATINGSLVLGATKDTRGLSVTVAQSGDKVAIGLVVANQN